MLFLVDFFQFAGVVSADLFNLSPGHGVGLGGENGVGRSNHDEHSHILEVVIQFDVDISKLNGNYRCNAIGV
jgi:hypothetical protein